MIHELGSIPSTNRKELQRAMQKKGGDFTGRRGQEKEVSSKE